MRGQDDVGQALDGCDEAFAVRGRLLREDVDRRAGERAATQRLGKGVEVDDRAARIVDEIGALLHRRDLGLADHVVRGRRLRHVQRDDVAVGEQGLQALDRLGVAMAQAVGVIVIDHAHAHRLGDVGELAADIAVADDAEHLAAHLEGAVGRLVPAALMRRARTVGDPAQQHDDLADGEFGDAAGVGEGRVEDGYAAQAGGVEIDLIGADREAADGEEALGGGEDRLGELGARADAEDMRLLDRLDQLGLVKRLRQAGQVGVAGLLQRGDGGIVDPLEQENAEAVLREGKPVGGEVHGALRWSSDAPARPVGRKAPERPL